ncbi:FixH family protein [Umezawaea sp.]|uniref:FixH family protein n=1 Tax=Umezawaea sp. TaxID=1955258 RepID=UPI002ED143F8
MSRRTVVASAVLAVVVALVALVVRSTAGGGATTASASGERYTVRLSVEDPRTGPNSLGFEVTDRSGAPVLPDEVTVEPVMPQMGHALAPVTALPEGRGRFRAPAADLPMAGPWQITVSLHDASGVDHVVLPLLVKG